MQPSPSSVLEHFLSPPKRNPTPNSSHFLISYFQALSPRQPQMCVLSLQICLFWIFHVNRIIRKVVFVTSFFHFAYSQRSSRLWHVLRLHSFLWPNSPLYGYATFYLSILWLIDFCVVSTLGILRRMLLWTFLKRFLCGLFFFKVYCWEGIGGSYGKSILNILRNCQTSPKWRHYFTFPPAVSEFQFLHGIPSHCLFNFCHLRGCQYKWILLKS